MDEATSLLAYQRKDTAQTLAEGLSEYYRRIPALTAPASLPPDEAAFFRAHDVSHVVFGCGTSPPDELLVGAWTFCATTASLRDILRYARAGEVRRIRRDFGLLRGMRLLFHELPRLWRVVRRARQMPCRWPLHEYEPYLDRPLREIRAEFNIDPL